MKPGIVLVSAAVALVSPVVANATCTNVSGTAQAVDRVCTESPIGLCIDGTITGSLAGTYTAVFQSITPAPTLAQPLRMAIAMESTFSTPAGNLNTHETGWLVLNDVVGAVGCVAGCALTSSPDTCLAACVTTYGRTYFHQDISPYAGTGSYGSVSGGEIDLDGHGDLTSGISYGNYSGQICR